MMSKYFALFKSALTIAFLTSYAVAGIWADANSVPPAGCNYQGNWVINCSFSELTRIPDGLNPHKLVLVMPNSKGLTALENDSFISVKQTQLCLVDLSNCAIERIELKAFRGLSSLTSIYLHGNKIATLELGVFAWTAKLEELHLWGNPLFQLSANYFTPNNHIQLLDLDFCHFTSLPQNAFSKLIHLKELFLRLNSLTQLSKELFIPLTELKNVELGGNPLTCDCALISFRDFFNRRSDIFKSVILENCGRPSELARFLSLDLPTANCSKVPFEISEDADIGNVSVKGKEESEWQSTWIWVALTVILGLTAQSIGFFVWRRVKRARTLRGMTQVRFVVLVLVMTLSIS
jgi:hypothetical protein